MRKDWIGNKKSTYTPLGASNHSDEEREEYDYYATDSIAIDALLEKAELDINIWEPACGEGHLSKRLSELGYNVYATDLINRGSGGYRTSLLRMKCGMAIFLLIHHTNMPGNLLSML